MTSEVMSGSGSARLLASLGTPYDITLHELRIECFFPADEAMEQALMGLRPRS